MSASALLIFFFAGQLEQDKSDRISSRLASLSSTKSQKQIPDSNDLDDIIKGNLKNQDLASHIPIDTPYVPTRFPYYRPKDRFTDFFSSGIPNQPLFYSNPSFISTDIQLKYDSLQNYYTIQEQFGDLPYRPPTLLKESDFNSMMQKKIMLNNWRELSGLGDSESATSSGIGALPKIPVENKLFDRVFGGDFVEFKPTGFVNLDFSVQRQKVANPTLPIRQQRNTNFLFDPHANVNLIGKVGEKLEIGGAFDTKASFQFENNFKLEYKGFEEDILQKVEFGNVSFPLTTSLIQGNQNLFGVSTELRFGKLRVKSVFSNQRARAEQINLQGGAQRRTFEIAAGDYEDNRHFFLAHFFRNNYERWMSTLPSPLSGVQITRIEAYVTNRVSNTSELRNVLAFKDLGETEANRINPNLTPDPSNPAPRNTANNLFTLTAGINNADNAVVELEALGVGLENGEDFTVLRAARKLDSREYTYNAALGTLSLLTPLRNDEVLAVAFEYTLNGANYRVGELTDDYANRGPNEAIKLKMVRPNEVRLDLSTWDLMMKNVYSLGANQITPQNFLLRVIYRDDLTGIDNPSLQEGIRTNGVPLLQLLELDNLNTQNDPQRDGNFDYVEGITIDSRNGRIYFPVLEPFGTHLQRQFDPVTETGLINKYVFDALYSSTKADALQAADKNKFFLLGSYEASASTDVVLPGINIAEGSVVVKAGNIPLTEGDQYTVDYITGRVTITDQSVLNSGKDITIDYEKADLFNFITRRVLGTRFEYEFNPNFIVGSTIMSLRERPVITRVNIGDDPINNTILGADVSYKSKSRFLTRAVDFLPLIQTKEESSIDFYGEYAQLFPGASPLSGQVSYIDDFEGTRTAFNFVRAPQANWKLGATPQLFPEASSRELDYAYRRAKMAWYNVDNLFYRDGGNLRPPDIDVENHYIRSVSPQEIFPNRQRQQIQANELIFDLAYYPSERGPYNYNPNINAQGRLPNPSQNYGAITRAITSDIDFDNANIEYLEFWMLDPFLPGENGVVDDGSNNATNNTTGGDLYINLGNVSEDVIPDGRHAFEQGLPIDGNELNVTENIWGRVTDQQYITNAFDNDLNARQNQDVGLDGLKSSQESQKTEYQAFVNAVNAFVADPTQRQSILNDISADDFSYYLSNEFDANNSPILERYKNFNGLENNSPVGTTTGGATPSATNLPDNEDLNIDNTVSSVESYYQYKINLRPGQLQVGQNYIIDEIRTNNNQTGEDVSWYLFRIPVREFDDKIGNIDGFKSIRFLRMFLTSFQQPVVLRFAQYQLVANQWRRYLGDLNDRTFGLPSEPYDPDFNVSTVNIEENGAFVEGNTPYVLAPGVIRDRDVTNIINREINEQSIRLSVTGLRDKDARAVFRNYNLDLLSYKRVKMFLHAESVDAQDGEVTAFIRLGTDFTDNYYEIEVPLTITPNGSTVPEVIWPVENEIDVAFEELTGTKNLRNESGQNVTIPFQRFVDRYRITVVGNPDLSAVLVSMIGVRNPDLKDFDRTDDRLPKSVTIWANEFRISDFDQTAGWAATARANVKIADFAQVTGSLRYTTFGFGSINQRISERARENTLEFDISANIALDKFLPEKLGIRLPMFVSYERSRITPRFNPLDPDVELDQSLNRFESQEERNDYRRLVETNFTRRSINFTNVRKIRTNPDAKINFFDIENFTFTWAMSEELRSDIFTAEYLNTRQRVGVAYAFQKERTFVEPFAKLGFLKAPYLKWLKDFNFNLLPNSFNVAANLDRTFTKTLFRGGDLTTNGVDPIFQKQFLFTRNYGLQWNLSKSLSLNYSANVLAVIDEPIGSLDTESKRDSVLTNLLSLGRMKNFQQQANLTYRVPLDKFPITDWMTADAAFNTAYTWVAGAVAPSPGTLGQADTLGNIITNARDRSLRVGFDMSKLYKKSKFLAKLDAKPKPQPKKGASPPQKPAGSDTIRKKLGDYKLVQILAKPLVMIKNMNFTYTKGEQTIFPGFLPAPRFFGLSEGFDAPGYGFALLGSQSSNIKQEAILNDWLAPSSFLNNPFSQNVTENLKISANIEPIRDFKITLDAQQTRRANYAELFRFNEDTGLPETQNPVRNGSFSISTITFMTAFKRDNSLNENPNFTTFEQNRGIILQRLRAINPAFDPSAPENGDYALNSQDVLIPAFLAAYTGVDAGTIGLSAFPKTPLPNWRIDYTGLSKIPFLSDVFSSVSINHAYQSNYGVNNYTSSLQYGEGFVNINTDERNYVIPNLTNEAGDFLSVYVVSQVVLSERFSPLLGINLRTKSNISIRMDYSKERDLSLNLSNAQLAEIRNDSFTFSLGFIKSKMKLPIKSDGKFIILENDVDLRLDITMRDTRTLQRQLDDVSTVTAGNLNFQLRPVIGYVVNKQLNIQFYFEKNINDPRISSSFRRSTTAGGIQLRYNLAL